MKTRTITDTTILDCGHVPSKHESFTTGYGVDKDNRSFCYECAAKMDIANMKETGRTVLYLAGDYITNWPGSLRIKVSHQRTGKHNIARTRTDAWFTLAGEKWHGVQYGSNSDLIYCKRINS